MAHGFMNKLSSAICDQVIWALKVPQSPHIKRVDMPAFSIDDIRMQCHFRPLEAQLLALRQLKGREVEDIVWVQRHDADCAVYGGEVGFFRIILKDK